jgi:uncharacterized protein YbjT (DUF2867 family)
MRILVADATGALGRQIVSRLIAAGHEVAGTTRTPAKAEVLRRAGAAALASTPTSCAASPPSRPTG